VLSFFCLSRSAFLLARLVVLLLCSTTQHNEREVSL
jgi:hypothetical protein